MIDILLTAIIAIHFTVNGGLAGIGWLCHKDISFWEILATILFGWMILVYFFMVDTFK